MNSGDELYILSSLVHSEESIAWTRTIHVFGGRRAEREDLTRVIMMIREYKPDDCALLAQLFYNTVHAVNSKDYTKEQLDVWATGNIDLNEWNRSFLEHTTLIAMCDNTIVGFADMGRDGYLDRLYVHKDYQGKGIATALINELERRAKEKHVVCFETYASITARPFFEKLGYTVQTENIVVRGGIPLTNFRMTKAVSDNLI